MQSDITFDNIYIGHSVEDAAAFAAETYGVKRPLEEAEEAKSKPKPEDLPKLPSDLKFMDDPVTFLKEKLELFVTLVQKDPIEAIKFMPEVAGGIGGVLALLIAVIVGLSNIGGSAAPSKEDIKKSAQKAKGAATDAKDEAAAATTSGSDATKPQASQRTTRASGKAE